MIVDTHKIGADIGNSAPGFLSLFDSATDMAGALGSFLNGKVYRGLGTSIRGPFISTLINHIPDFLKQKLYLFSGIKGAVSASTIDDIDAEEVAEWIYEMYPKRKYPVIAIGSSNGALNHLYAAMGIPWLPQTFLIPVYKGEKFSVDLPKETIEWSRKPGELFLKNNPGWHLSQMMDPNQDRLRSGAIAYFRVKKLVLGQWYKKFIRECLEPQGTLLVADCQLSWPVVRIGDRHTFQFGGLGSVLPEEYYSGSERVTDFLKQNHSKVSRWDIPKPDGDGPEAEWGFHSFLMEDILQLAQKEGYGVGRLSHQHPQDPSSMVADLYREAYQSEGQPSDRLLVESFTLHSPLLAMQTSSVPYWLFFNSNNAADRLEEYLFRRKKFREIYMMILSHGKKSLGGAEITRWKALVAEAEKGGFVGTDPEEYPTDLGVYFRYDRDLENAIPERYPTFGLTWKELEAKMSDRKEEDISYERPELSRSMKRFS